MVATLEHSKEFWNEFGLGALQKQLDEYAADMAVRQDEAELGRKKLIEMSKDFKKSATDEVRKTVSPLVKAFQSEIDSLTRRSKAGRKRCGKPKPGLRCGDNSPLNFNSLAWSTASTWPPL